MRRNTAVLVTRRVLLALLIFCSHILQNVLSFPPEIFGVRCWLLISLTVCIGMFERESAGLMLGLFAGLLWDVVSGHGDGFNTLFLMVIGAVCGLLINLWMRNNLLTALLLSGGAHVLYILLYMVFFILAGGVQDAGFLLLRYYLPTCLYSLLLTPIYYFAVRFLMKRLQLVEEYDAFSF